MVEFESVIRNVDGSLVDAKAGEYVIVHAGLQKVQSL